MKVLGLLLAALAVASGLKEESFGRIKAINGPVVTLFYHSDLADTHAATEVVKEVEGLVDRWSFFSCDTKARGNARGAKQANLQDSVHVFVRTREDGVEEFRMPLTVPNLLRYLRLRGVAGDPADVLPFTSEDDLMALVDTTHTPVFLKAFEPWCAHCFKMQRGFEAGATFFKNRVHFMEVQCSASASATAFCAKHGAELLPTLLLFTGEEVLPFNSSRSLAAYELFFHQNRAALPRSPLGVQPAFNAGLLGLTPSEAALIGHGYPILEEDVGKPDTSGPIITAALNEARRGVVRDLAEEAMADVTVAAGEGRSIPTPKPAAAPKAHSPPASTPVAHGGDDKRLAKLEKRLAKLEKLVKELVFERAMERDEL